MGANAGGEGSSRLRYAASDARSFAAVLTELGGVASGDLVLLMSRASPLSGRRSALRGVRGLGEQLGQAMRASLLYYSGHSDEDGLFLGKESWATAELRAAIENVPPPCA